MNTTAKRRYRGFSRSRNLLIAAVVLIVILVIQTATSIVGAVVAQQQAAGAAHDTFSYVGDLTAERVARDATTTQNLVATTASAIENSGGGLTLDDVIDILYLNLERAPQVRAAYVGFPDGRFVSVTRQEMGFMSQKIEVDPSYRATKTTYDPQFNIIQTVFIDLDYDPRLRPWYQAGEGSLYPVWTEPDLIFDTDITFASTADSARDGSGLLAVAGADIDLSQMTSVLDSLPLGAGSRAFVLSPDRRVIAASSGFEEQLRSISSQTHEVPLVSDIGVESQEVATRYTDGDVFGEVAGRLTLERGFAPADRLNWILRLEADKSALSTGLDRLQVTINLITAFSALGVIAVGVVMYRMWVPLRSLNYRARTDQLTGLLNRHEYRARGATMLRRAQTRGEHVVFIVFDMDNFKEINDEFGHEAGDTALAVVANGLLATSRESDVVARLGGDEFVMMQVIAHPSHVPSVVERVRSVVEHTVQSQAPGGEHIGLTAGYSLTQEGAFDLDTLMAQADAALIEGKRTGRGASYGYERPVPLPNVADADAEDGSNGSRP